MSITGLQATANLRTEMSVNGLALIRLLLPKPGLTTTWAFFLTLGFPIGLGGL